MSKKNILILTVALLLLSVCLFSEENKIEYKNIGELLSDNSFSLEESYSILSDNDYYTEIEFTLPKCEYIPNLIGEDKYLRIFHPKAGYLHKEGFPELPIFSTMIAIPNTGEIFSEEIRSENIKIVHDIDVFPSQGLDMKVSEERGFLKNYDFYESGSKYPSDNYILGSPAIMRNFRVVPITFQPYTYNPVTRELVITENITLRINYDQTRSGDNEIHQLRPFSRSFENVYRNTIVNYESAINNRNTEYQQRSMIIIHPLNASIQGTVDQLADWKRRKGFYVAVQNTQVLPTNTAIRNYIQTAYNTWEHPPEYVLLLGAGTGSLSVPFWSVSTDNKPGDHHYTTIDGDDILSDVFIGRISVQNANQLATVWNKIAGYEMYPYMANTEWYERPLLVGDPSTASGISPVFTSKYIRDIMLLHNPDYDIVEIYTGFAANQINNAINQGVMIFNFRGIEGISGWSPGGSLVNGFMLPHSFLITCNTLGYNGTSQTENMVTLGTPGTPSGGITAIGLTSIETNTAFNNIINGGFHYGIFIEGARTMGEILHRGKVHLYNSYANSQFNLTNNYFHWTNLIGDPSLDIWLEVPQEMNVSYLTEVPHGTNFLDVLVTDGNNNPLTDAWVTIRRNVANNEVLFETDYTDSSGMITLYHDPAYGSVDLTVTKPGYIPYLSEFLITDEGVVSYHNIVFNTELNAGSHSNFVVILKNYSDEVMTGITGELSTNDIYVDIINSNSDFADMAPGALGQGLDLLSASVSVNAPDYHPVVFDLNLSDGENEWTTKFTLHINGSKLEIEEIVFPQTGIINPGETSNMYMILMNSGQVDLEDLHAELISYNQLLEVNQELTYFGSIPAGETAVNIDNLFSLTAFSQLLPGMKVALSLNVFNDDGFNLSIPFTLPIGVVTVDDPLGPDGYGYWCYDCGDTGYIDAPEYDWIEINPAFGGSGLNTGLAADHNNNQGVMTMDLPFTFRFYGEDYDEISICANGWAAFGEVDYGTQRNWRLPGPLGPNSLIAAFWDNLSLQNGGVYTYYDPIENYFVIQWCNAQNIMNNAPATFQIILYDPIYYPIFHGNGPIKIQYKIFNNVNNGTGFPFGNWGKYASIGLKDHTGTVGLEYTFDNQYPTAARVLGNETAIYFTGPPISYDDDYLVLSEVNVHTPSGEVYADEIIKLNIAVLNYGENMSENITGTITTTSGYVNIHNSVSPFVNIPSGMSGLNKEFFTFAVSGVAAANTVLPFILNLSSDTGNWEYNFNLIVKKPDIELKSFIINDLNGNNDGVADPGENIKMIFNLHNSSLLDTEDVQVSLSTASDYITIDNPILNIDKFPAEKSLQAVFDVDVSISTPVDTGILFELNVSSSDINDFSNNVSLGVSVSPEILTENFDTWLPEGWSIDNQPGNWSQSSTANAGGSSPEARLNWSPSFTGISRLISKPLNLMGATNVSLEFKHNVNNFSGGYIVGAAIRSDYGPWTTVWSINVSSSVPAETITVPIDSDDLHNPNFQICWFLDGNSYGLNQWYIDDTIIHATLGNSGIISGNVILESSEYELNDVIVYTDYFGTNPDEEGNYELYVNAGNYDVLAAWLPFHQSPYYSSVEIGLGENLEGYDFVMNYLEPAENLVVNYENGYVTLTWDYDFIEQRNMKEMKNNMLYREQFQYFNIYRQYYTGLFERIAQTEEMYNINSVNSGDRYSYYVTVQYNTGESKPTETVTLYTYDLIPPSNLQGEFYPEEGVLLTWDIPRIINLSRSNLDNIRNNPLLGYKLFRDDQLIAEINDPEVLEYLDSLFDDGLYTYHIKAIYEMGESLPSEPLEIQILSTESEALPLVNKLYNNFPNPFNPETNIRFSLAEESDVSLKIYNIKGNLVKTILLDRLQSGTYNFVWNGTDEYNKKVGSGVYFYKLKTENFSAVRKALLLK